MNTVLWMLKILGSFNTSLLIPKFFLNQFLICSFNYWQFLAMLVFYVPLIFAPIGNVLNILIIIIYSNFSFETKNTTRLYYISIAISELGTLLFEDIWFGLFGIGWDFVFNGHNLDFGFLCNKNRKNMLCIYAAKN